MDGKSIGKAIRTARTRMGVTQYDLSIKSGVKPSSISLIENGDRIPRADTLAKLCKALDIHYSDATEGFDNNTPDGENLDIAMFIRKNPDAVDKFLDYIRERLGRTETRGRKPRGA